MEVYKNRFKLELELKHERTFSLLDRIRYDLALGELYYPKCPQILYTQNIIADAERFADFVTCMTTTPKDAQTLRVSCTRFSKDYKKVSDKPMLIPHL